MDLTHAHQLLAVPTGKAGADKFFETAVGKTIVAICGAIGVIIIVVCILRMIKDVTRGRPGDGFKVLTFGLVIGGLLFQLDITVNALGTAGALVGNIFSSFDEISKAGG